MGFHAMVAPGTPQPILDGVRSGYDGPFTLAQDYTVVNITPDQIVTRMVEVVPWDYIVTDPNTPPGWAASNRPLDDAGLPEWLDDTVIPVAEIEAFKKQLADMGAR